MGVGGIVGIQENNTQLNIAEFTGHVGHDHHMNGFCTVQNTHGESDCIGSGGTWNDAQDVGGIAGRVTGGSPEPAFIDQVTSKAHVEGNYYVGGIAGHADYLVLTNSYSVSSVWAHGEDNNNDSFAGGLAGYMFGGSIEHSFHTIGFVSGMGNQTDGLAIKSASPPVTVSESLTTLSSSIISSSTYAEIRDDATYTANNFPATEWDHDDPDQDIPRLKWEGSRACSGKFDSVTTPFAAGDGTESNPYQICNAAQLANIRDHYIDGKFFELKRPIDAYGGLGMQSQAVLYEEGGSSAFSGTLIGNGHIISYGASSSSGGNIGLFDVVGANGVVRDLRTYGVIDVSASPTGGFGIIAGTNKGILDQTVSYGKIVGPNALSGHIGGVAGVNEGMIVGARTYNEIEAQHGAGGIAGYNKGGILYSHSNAQLFAAVGVCEYFGGIAAFNEGDGANSGLGDDNFYDKIKDTTSDYDGVIQETRFDGFITARNPSDGYYYAFYKTGGITGYNNGRILNVASEGRLDLGPGLPIAVGDVLFDASSHGDPNPSPAADGSTDGAWLVTVAGANNLISDAGPWQQHDVVMVIKGVAYHYDASGGAGTEAGYDSDKVSFAAGGTTPKLMPAHFVGGCIGYNGASGDVDNVLCRSHDNTPSDGSSRVWPSTFGILVGKNVGAINNTVVDGSGLGQFGANTLSADDVNGVHTLDRNDSDVTVVSTEITNNASVSSWTNVNSDTASTGVIVADGRPVVIDGERNEIISVSDSQNFILEHNHSEEFPTGVSLIGFHDSWLGATDANDFYTTNLGWDVGEDWDTNTWEMCSSGCDTPHLSSIYRWMEYGHVDEYYDTVQQYD
jgi:hypothetical protein